MARTKIGSKVRTGHRLITFRKTKKRAPIYAGICICSTKDGFKGKGDCHECFSLRNIENGRAGATGASSSVLTNEVSER